MIAVRLEGRLGNQLFQYAFIYATAKKLGVKFYIDQGIERYLVDEYFDVNKDYFSFFQHRIFSIQGFKNIFSYHLKQPFYNIVRKVLGLRQLTFNSNIDGNSQISTLGDKVYYIGHFQSEDYFSEYKNDVAKLFNVKNIYQQQYLQVATQIPADKTVVVIHVRRGDYLGLNWDLPDSYYHKIISDLGIADPYYVFVSDDPDYIDQHFAYLKEKYISRNSEIIDLQLIMNANICILSNSSFSWWGAWLNTKKDKKIYAPQYWLGYNDGKEYPTGIFNNQNFRLINPV